MAIKKAIANKNVASIVPRTMDFKDKWLSAFGRPVRHGSWLIYGGSGSGKTTFTLQLCKYLSQFGRVAYNSLEQGLSASLQIAWRRVEMVEAGSNIILLNKEPLNELKERLRKRKSPDVVVIDSLMCMDSFGRREYVALLNEFPRKLFIFLAHEKRNRPDPAIGEIIRRLSDVKIHVEGYIANVTTRFEVPEIGEGGAPLVIWEQGAAEYRAKLTTQTK